MHRVHRGVIAVGHPLLTGHARWIAGVPACGGGAALGHRSAASLWGVLPYAGSLIDVLATEARQG